MKLVFATHNENKVKEVKSLLPKNFKILSLNDIGCFDEIPETSPTIEGNAQLKVAYVKANFGLDCFADDTGLEVPALNNEPGVYSARYAGPQKNSLDNMNKLLTNLKNVTNRDAHFKTVIALAISSEIKFFTGICKGIITFEKKGNLGFGYDPIFQVLDQGCRAAQLTSSEKITMSHRGQALAILQRALAEA